jgi:hypothetical protein
MKTLATLMLATLFALGCGNKDDNNRAAKPAPTEPATNGDTGVDNAEVSTDSAMPDPAEVEVYMKATIAAVDAAGGDCTKLAAPVVELAKENTDLLAKLAAPAASDQVKQWKAENAELYASFATAMRAIGACAREAPELVEVLKSLSPAKKPAPAAAPE